MEGGAIRVVVRYCTASAAGNKGSSLPLMQEAGGDMESGRGSAAQRIYNKVGQEDIHPGLAFIL